MGCDIHEFVEVQIDGKWHLLGNEWREEDGTALPISQVCIKKDAETAERFEPFDGRNYYFFAALADVRNAGTSDWIVPMYFWLNLDVATRTKLLKEGTDATTRDVILPQVVDRLTESVSPWSDDASPESMAVSEFWNENGHSHWHYTLEQLQQVRNSGYLSIPLTMRAMVTPEQKARYELTGEKPQSWCLWGSSMVELEWSASYHERLGGALDCVLEQLEAVAHAYTNNDPTSVRYLFFFDN
jgi:hypothetical protein